MPYQRKPTSIARRSVYYLNGLKHGGTARRLFLPEENPDEFFALLEDAFALYQPRTERDAGFVADTVHARWFLLRRQRAYDSYEYALCVKKPDIAEWTAEESHKLRLMDRYKIQAERALRRAMKNVESVGHGKGRRIRWQDLYELQRERCEWERNVYEVAV
jgi:hypothetical protein